MYLEGNDASDIVKSDIYQTSNVKNLDCSIGFEILVHQFRAVTCGVLQR